MINYKLSISDLSNHLIKVEMSFSTDNENVLIRLPKWRPGRYSFANYSNNLSELVLHSEGNLHKTGDSEWKIESQEKNISLSYLYCAKELNAGGSWITNDLFYVNLINLLMSAEGIADQKCSLELDIPEEFEVVTQLHRTNDKFLAEDYHYLVDSPVLASSSIRKIKYSEGDTEFFINVWGDLPLDDKQLVDDFSSFTQGFMRMMDGFPTRRYDFILLVFPFRHYHGVEHQDSTVITIGPGQKLTGRELYKELMGVSSHELFHTWNVTRIRPRELAPYDYSKENYYESGFITEGLTTYYGDLMLARIEYFSVDEYLNELNRLANRHFQNPSRLNISLAESSFDLWQTGYGHGPAVSIYVKGALISLMLDLQIIIESNGTQSLDDLVRKFWKSDFHEAYSVDQYLALVSNYISNVDEYFERYVYGTDPLENELMKLMSTIGVNAEFTEPDILKQLGILSASNKIQKIHVESPASTVLEVQDQILHVFNLKNEVEITVKRLGKEYHFKLPHATEAFYSNFTFQFKEDPTDKENQLREYWLYRK